MGHTYNEKILVDWASLLFVLERRFQTAVRHFKDNSSLLNELLADNDQVASSKQARVLLLDCSNAIELAGLANSVRLFLGREAVRYDLTDIRAIRSELRKYFEEVADHA